MFTLRDIQSIGMLGTKLIKSRLLDTIHMLATIWSPCSFESENWSLVLVKKLNIFLRLR